MLRSVQVAADGRKATLKIDGLVQGHVHHLNFKGLRSRSGMPLLNSSIYYTINELPK